MTQPSAIHHIHRRERLYKKSKRLQPYPHTNAWIRFLDKFLIVVAVIGPLATLPQIFDVYVNKNISGVSLASWSMYALIAIPWLVYGMVHKEKPIAISYFIILIFNTLIVIGILIH